MSGSLADGGIDIGEGKLTSEEVLTQAERAVIEIMSSTSVPAGERRRAAEFIIEHNKAIGTTDKGGVATKEDLERVGTVVGEIKAILEGLAVVGTAKGIAQATSKE